MVQLWDTVILIDEPGPPAERCRAVRAPERVSRSRLLAGRKTQPELPLLRQ